MLRLQAERDEGLREDPDSAGCRVLAACLAHKTLHLHRLQGTAQTHFTEEIYLIILLLPLFKVHFQNKKILIIYIPPCHPRCPCLSSVKNKLRFLKNTFQDFCPSSGLQWEPTG